jgi:hypothetical protein
LSRKRWPAKGRLESKAGFTAIMAFMTAVERIAVIQSALVAPSRGLESANSGQKITRDRIIFFDGRTETQALQVEMGKAKVA